MTCVKKSPVFEFTLPQRQKAIDLVGAIEESVRPLASLISMVPTLATPEDMVAALNKVSAEVRNLRGILDDIESASGRGSLDEESLAIAKGIRDPKDPAYNLMGEWVVPSPPRSSTI
jgi:hypothetical protein